ncbi:MAG: DNA protecting protein DprA [Candidatus Moranbacteria bacterium RIFCSPHIGHO2_01_FULL_55_24]|nr:MAG: DNA protecting protein DprA [Candidatus Moranbacteria bacterium RIFCSPHIGHO2_01_FULL_55_24]
MQKEEYKYLNAFRSLAPVGDKTLRLLLERFGSAEAAWKASAVDFAAMPGISKSAGEALARRETLVNPEEAWELVEKAEIRMLREDDPLYPRVLREIPDRPLFLYVRGSYDWTREKPAIAIVGSRKFTHYGEQAAERLAYDLARAGCVIVSGLAFGIDKIAHTGALQADGETLAVLAGGIDDAGINPRSHVPLGKRILEAGALVSEFPPGTIPLPAYFPMRNRIIAGISLGTLVIEAAEQSGSLITARLALEYDREVFAVPGSIFSPASAGTNALLRSGAKAVTNVRDILEEFPLFSESGKTPGQAEAKPSLLLSEAEEKVLAALSHDPLHVDRIIKAARLGTIDVQSALTMLELKGIARNIGGMHYIRQYP